MDSTVISKSAAGTNQQLVFAVALVVVLLAVFSNAEVGAAGAGNYNYNYGPPMVYNTTSGPVSHQLNVHLVPHTHDDVGWLKTVDQYYTGSNNSIQNAAVHLILDNVITALRENPDRKFIYVEQGFFQRWWREQTPRKQKIVRKLVKSGQLEFINGGWCMHDEATVHYIDMIDQTTLGHKFIKKQFGKIPRIGWQIDPFGHSAVQAYLLSAEIGFDALYFARLDYQDRLNRLNKTAMEMIWQPSKSFGSSSQIFTGALYDGYGPPQGFNFDMDSFDTPIQDDPLLFDYNVQDRVDAFVSSAQSQAQYYRTNHIMWTMGSDFQYQNAHGWFKQLDKFINWVNQDGRVNTFYSTPSLYTDAKFAANVSWPLKEDDFFPYADCPHCYWTGYFTSRPGLKGYVRILSSYYLFARQLEFLVGRRTSGPNTDSLAEAMGIAQHHDAVSGTEQQHTANDYAKRLSIGASEATEVVNLALGCLAEKSNHVGCQSTKTEFSQCLLLNISYCPLSESKIAENKKLVILVYNILGWNRTDYIRIPVSRKDVKVMDSNGVEVPSQLVPISSFTTELRQTYVKAYLGVAPGTAPPYWLVFPATVPALGYSTYIVSTSDIKGSASPSNIETVVEDNVVKFGSNKPHENIDVGVSYLYYGGNTGDDQKGADGAYLFRPVSNTPSPVNKTAQVTFINGPLVKETWQHYSSWIYQVTREYKGKTHKELEFQIGPIPIDDAVGKDVIVRFDTNIESDNIFYTDSNGRDFIKRVRNYRADWDLEVNEPVAGNYYPLNLGMFIKDSKSEFSVLVDRAVGGASIENGQLELMLHRRLVRDDGRGVGEALNETVCIGPSCQGLTVHGKVYLHVDPVNEGSKWRRSMGQEVYSPFQLAFTTLENDESWTTSHIGSFSAIKNGYNLPENVALVTLQELEDGQTLIRLAHLYEVDEDKHLSSKAYVDLKQLFPDHQVAKITEMSLSANQVKSSMKPPLKWRVEGSNQQGKIARGGPVDKKELIVELAPMEIRTFMLKFL